jgi:hypothetical protein
MHEKKRAEIMKVATTRVKGGVKRSSDTDIASVMSAKLSKNTLPHEIASAIAARITLEASGPKNGSGASGSKAGGGGSGSKTTAGAKKVVAPVKKWIAPAIGALAKISLKESQESSLPGQAVRP